MIFVFEKNLTFAQGRVAKNFLVKETRNYYFKTTSYCSRTKVRKVSSFPDMVCDWRMKQ